MELVIKGSLLEDSEGILTPLGMRVAHGYAASWLAGHRDLTLESKYPSLVGLFSDIRSDEALARMHAG